MNTNLLHSLLAVACVTVISSCIPYDENGNPIPQKKTTTGSVTDQKQQELEAKREVLRKKELERKRELAAQNGDSTGNESTDGPTPGSGDTTGNGETGAKPKPPKNHPVAAAVPGKEGFVFSPFNNKVVDVRNIASGTLVADPQYPASEKKHFRVP